MYRPDTNSKAATHSYSDSDNDAFCFGVVFAVYVAFVVSIPDRFTIACYMSINPWAIILILLGAALVIIGFHGSQHGVMSAFKGQV